MLLLVSLLGQRQKANKNRCILSSPSELSKCMCKVFTPGCLGMVILQYVSQVQ